MLPLLLYDANFVFHLFFLNFFRNSFLAPLPKGSRRGASPASAVTEGFSSPSACPYSACTARKLSPVTVSATLPALTSKSRALSASVCSAGISSFSVTSAP